MNPHLTHQLAGERQRDLMTEATRARSTAPARRLARRAVLAAVLPAALAAVVLPSAAEAASVSAGNGAVNVLDRGFFSGFSAETNNVTASWAPRS